MPEPMLILQSMGVAAIVSAAILAAIGLPRRPASAARIGIGRSLAIGLGFLAGCWMLGRMPRWPPKVDLDRLLVIVLPLVVASECALARSRVASRVTWAVRALVALASARTLLHNSVYLVGPETSRWSTVEVWLLLSLMAALVIIVWFSIQWFTERQQGTVCPLVLAITALSAGVAVMLSGYATGGQLAMPLAAAIAAPAGVCLLFGIPTTGSVGVGFVLTCCLIFVGKFFAELSTFHALLLVSAPLWCLLTELPLVRNHRPWIKNALAIILVAMPLAVVLVQLQRQFVKHSSSPTNSVPSQPSTSDYY